MLVQASPQATAIATLGISAPSACAALITMGLCTAHCPPPDGMKMFTMPALMKVQNGSVAAEAIDTNHSDKVAASPESIMMAMIPA
ncbi:Uncharacterised protein [Bordetella pertussis]|nr:Uncharacterised protein [Bordetella pertussis]